MVVRLIIRYVNDTLGFGIWFLSDTNAKIVEFSNVICESCVCMDKHIRWVFLHTKQLSVKKQEASAILFCHS